MTLDTSAAVETLRFLRRLVDDGVLPAEVVTFDRDRSARMLAAGRADMFVGASYQAETLAEETGVPLAQVADRFGFMPVPAGPHGPPRVLCGGMVYCIPRQARRPELAMRLLRALTAPRWLAEVCRETGQLPPRRSVMDALAPVSSFHAETAALLETRRPAARRAGVRAGVRAAADHDRGRAHPPLEPGRRRLADRRPDQRDHRPARRTVLTREMDVTKK